MQLLLIRHAQSDANARRMIHGWSDDSLTEDGLAQAKRLADFLARRPDITAIYCSPLKRALETIEPTAIRLGIKPLIEPDLREINYGRVEGLTVPEFRSRYPDLWIEQEKQKTGNFTWPGGESRQEFWKRSIATIEKIVAARPGTSVVVVAHVGTISSYLSNTLTGSPARWKDYNLDLGGITELRIEGSKTRLEAHNDRTYMERK
jgi:alpha-ribazole phosphatase